MNTKFVAVEINPLLICIMNIKRFFHPQKKQLQIKGQDLFKTDLSRATKIYLYVGPYVMLSIMKKIAVEKPPALQKIVSYMYDFQLDRLNFPLPYHHRVVQGVKKIYILDLI